MSKEWHDRIFEVGDRVRIYCHEEMRGVIVEENPAKGYGWRVRFDDGSERQWYGNDRLLHDTEASPKVPDWGVVGPELLAALQECSTLLVGIPAAKNSQRVADVIHDARAAIAKAEGRS